MKKLLFSLIIGSTFSFLATQHPNAAALKKYYMSYECRPKEENFTIYRTADENSFHTFDKSSKPLKGQPIHLNINQFDGKLFDFYSESDDFSPVRAKGGIAYGWGTNSYEDGVYYEIEPKYWNCEAYRKTR
ncbi:hypothetical protein [Rhizobium oryzicola]|uniref:Uncharacterized protein n=1 Tax=Rhizobium oryzicola TaxID=1232668 RepID=A0ABT8SU10_9HYPH|nr:hypothetical protein [Rhizobium oryzicola]MDO1581511.1 hypothetical protein [Rhizobium oryzicola]